jgi:dephospho-CoA kinase
MPFIILLSGWAGSGKDSAAELLVDEMSFERVAFADVLKAEVSAAAGIPVAMFYENALKDSPLKDSTITPRELLIRYAIERKKLDPDAYSRIVVAHILKGKRSCYVISDWRFRHEYEFLYQKLSENYCIIRGRIIRSSVNISSDSTEHDLDDEYMDFTIHNDGSISDLRDAIKVVLRNLKK